jgi:3-methyladenine DNA glycosylase AlkC
MVAEKAKNTDKGAESADESRIHDQVIDAIKKSQEATLKVISAWSESVAKIAPKLPEMPKLPLVDSLPKPDEISEKFFKFAQDLLATEHEFVQRLLDALPGHDKPSE